MTLPQFIIALLLLLTAITSAATHHAASAEGRLAGKASAVIVNGTFTPSPLESDECYFPIGNVLVAAKPDSIECNFIREHLLNRPGKLTFVMEE